MGQEYEAYEPEDGETAVAVKESTAIVFKHDNAIGDAFTENLGGEGISLKDLDRVKIPGAGGTTWTIPTVDGEDETKQFDGVILETKLARACWQGSFSGGSQPPDCSSDDMVRGHGNPGGLCAQCPFDQFGTDKNGEGRAKACKESRILFILRKNEIMPLVLAAKLGGAGKHIKKYLLGLSMKGRKMYEVTTRLTLKKGKNADGIDYSEIHLEDLGPVENPQEMAGRVATFKALLATQKAADFVGA